MKRKAKDPDFSLVLEQRIVFEDEHLLVLNKPAGLLSQEDGSPAPAAAPLLKELRKRGGKPLAFLAPVHRLDRNTSGALILAKTPAAAAKLTEAMKAGNVSRTYVAVVKGDPGERGSFDFPLKKDPRTNEVSVHPSGQAALTHFIRKEKRGPVSLVEVRLETGRSHQIRVHFSHAKHALVGDKKYAPRPWNDLFHRPALHAVCIEFTHPAKNTAITVDCPLEADLRELLAGFE